MIKTVQTKYGTLEGVESNAGYALFRGIPYAAPPVGELRWRAPRDPESWEGVRVCDTYGPACAQFDRWDVAVDDVTDDTGHPYIRIPNYPYPPRMDEDCLYLNVYTPASSPDERLPVMMYIHGGGLQQWYGSDYEYCGDKLCAQGVVVVSITYRLNVFGFFTHPELAAESESGTSGNYGIMDQIQALKWIRENIAGFGGDPYNITCFGQSGGARATAAICCSPLARGYVAHASIQSGGGIGGGMPSLPREAMEKKGVEFMKAVGCGSIAEMRVLGWRELRDANDRLGGMMNGFNMYTDGWVLPRDIDECFANGLDRNVDVIIGCTVDEGANDKQNRFGRNTFASVLALADRRAAAGNKPVYVYVFDREQPGGDNVGVPHSCDNRYQFGTLDGSWRPYEQADWDLALTMQRYWANFARTGNPNGEGLAEWQVTTGGYRAMRLAAEGCAMTDYGGNAKLAEATGEIISRFRG